MGDIPMSASRKTQKQRSARCRPMGWFCGTTTTGSSPICEAFCRGLPAQGLLLELRARNTLYAIRRLPKALLVERRVSLVYGVRRALSQRRHRFPQECAETE